MAAEKTFLDTAIPAILIILVLGFIWSKFGKHFISLFEWVKETFRSKKHKEEPNSYSYIEYDGV